MGGILMCLCEILVGVLLLINPVGFTATIIVGLGWLLLIMGVVAVVGYFRMPAIEAAKQQTLVKGLSLVTVGLFCVLRYNWFIATFPMLALLYAVAMLITGLVRVQWTVDAIRLKKEKWYWLAIGAALTLAFAAIILMNPFTSTVFMWTFVAISLIVEAVLDIFAIIFTGKRRNSAA